MNQFYFCIGRRRRKFVEVSKVSIVILKVYVRKATDTSCSDSVSLILSSGVMLNDYFLFDKSKITMIDVAYYLL